MIKIQPKRLDSTVSVPNTILNCHDKNTAQKRPDSTVSVPNTILNYHDKDTDRKGPYSTVKFTQYYHILP